MNHLPSRIRFTRTVAFSCVGILLTTLASAVNFPSSDVPKNLLDPGTTTSTLTVPSSINIADINITLNITHGWITDLSASLISPGGTSVPLFNSVGLDGESNFTNTLFDDEASTSIVAGSAPYTGNFRPQGHLYAFDGQNAQGTWTLSISDSEATTAGTLNTWSIAITPGISQPVAGFVPSPNFGQAPLNVQFHDLSVPGSSPITTWAWTFGDGETSSEEDPAHLYALPGVYNVTLTVTTNDGSDTETQNGCIVAADHVPALDPIGLTLLSAACGLGSLITLRRKR